MLHRTRTFVLFLTFSLTYFVLLAETSLAETAHADATLRKALSEYHQKNPPSKRVRSTVGVYVADALTGEKVFESRGDEQLTPASVVKILTAVSALKYLGSDYTFPSEVFVEQLPSAGKGNGDVGSVFFRGYGDPSLVNERLLELARNMKHLGVKTVKDIIVDDSLFIDPPPPSGRKPYQAALSATSLNHNCYGISMVPGAPGKDAHVFLVPEGGFALEGKMTTRSGRRGRPKIIQSPQSRNYKVGAGIPDVKISVGGYLGSRSKPGMRYFTVPSPPGYLGGVLKEFLSFHGVKVRGEVKLGTVPSNAKLLRTYHSKSLVQILRDLNHYSNNFIGGQVLYALGQDSAGFFRMDRSLEKVTEMMTEYGIAKGSYTIVDGSGLKRENKISAKQLVTVLTKAYQDFSIAPDLISSLSRFGSTGTLSDRDLATTRRGRPLKLTRDQLERAVGVWGKTGTLTHVSSLAGYAKSEKGRVLAYAILINGKISKSDSMRYENGLVKVIVGTS